MIDEECVTAEALTHEGPSGAPRPIIIVQAASFDVFLLTNTERTLIRCGCKKEMTVSLPYWQRMQFIDFGRNFPTFIVLLKGCVKLSLQDTG